jgi:hypothetical protein
MRTKKIFMMNCAEKGLGKIKSHAGRQLPFGARRYQMR